MSNITRPGTETLKIEPCPCCGGEVNVSDCGYSSFNPGFAHCLGECGREWDLGYVDNEWNAGEIWNATSKRISIDFHALALIAIEKRASPNRATKALEKRAEELLDGVLENIIGATKTE